MPIDYSKWDNLDVSSSEDEYEDDENDGFGRPRVTKLDKPSSVTFGGPGRETSVLPGFQPGSEVYGTDNAAAAAALAEPSVPAAGAKTTADTPVLPPSTSPGGPPSSWTEHGGFFEELPSNLSPNTNKNNKRCLYWSQDRYSVALRIELLPAEKKVASVAVKGILPYRDRNAAVATPVSPLLVVVSATSGETLLAGDLPHPVHRTEEDEDEGDGETCLLDDWAVVTDTASADGDPRRFLMLTVYKAVPMEGLALWWRRPLADLPEADLETIRGGDEPSMSAQGKKSREFLKAWEEAHKKFRSKKGTRSPTKLA